MTLALATVPSKTPQVAAHDRAVAGGLASVIFLAVVVALAVGMRRLRARVALEHAERVLEQEIDALVQADEPRGGR